MPEEAGTTAAEMGFGWRKLQVMGAIIFLVAPLIPMIMHGFEPFIMIIVVPVLIGLLLVRFARRVGVIWVGVVCLALLAMNLPFLLPSLTHPEVPVDFVPTVMIALGASMAIISTIPAFGGGKGAEQRSATARALAVLTVLAIIAGAGTAFAAKGNIESQSAQSGDIEVLQKEFVFHPDKIEAQGQEVALHITNSDSTRHTFTIDKLGVDVSVAPGQAVRVTFTAAPGTYHFYCIPHAPDMSGDLTLT
ncbi:MAG TPA: cupredoxin domain-containing protein [Actinomycetota bacterium]|nr:cupredoxin domain-containing protein [Actinomycetota bacterium]